MKNFFLTLLSCLFVVYSCQDSVEGDYEKADNPQALAAIEGEYLNMIVTMPAGSTELLCYQSGSNTYGAIKDKNGAPLPPTFLPSPANCGFLPGTQRDSLLGTELEVLLLSARQATASLIPVRPIGVIRLLEGEESVAKIIAIPARESEQLIQVENFLDFAIQHDAAKQIIETWLLNSKGPGSSTLIGWEDEFFAWELVKSRSRRISGAAQ